MRFFTLTLQAKKRQISLMTFEVKYKFFQIDHVQSKTESFDKNRFKQKKRYIGKSFF